MGNKIFKFHKMDKNVSLDRFYRVKEIDTPNLHEESGVVNSHNIPIPNTDYTDTEYLGENINEFEVFKQNQNLISKPSIKSLETEKLQKALDLFNIIIIIENGIIYIGSCKLLYRALYSLPSEFDPSILDCFIVIDKSDIDISSKKIDVQHRMYNFLLMLCEFICDQNKNLFLLKDYMKEIRKTTTLKLRYSEIANSFGGKTRNTFTAFKKFIEKRFPFGECDEIVIDGSLNKGFTYNLSQDQIFWIGKTKIP